MPQSPAWLKKAKFELTTCPICQGSRTEEIADRPPLDREVELAWMFHSRRLKHPVPPTYLTDRVVFSQGPPLRLVRCLDCGQLYRNPRENVDTLHNTYAEASDNQGVYEALFENQRRYSRAPVRRIRRIARRISRGLAVGSYVGGFLAASREQAMAFTGIDVNEDVVAFCVARGWPAKVDTLENQTDFGKYDGLAIWNTFEQLPDVHDAAIKCRRLLRDGGCLALRIPNGNFYTRWRRRLDSRPAGGAEPFPRPNHLLGIPDQHGLPRDSMGRPLPGTSVVDH